MLKQADKLFFYGIIFIFITLFFANFKNAFFWDTIQLSSKHADYYLTTNFSKLLLPNSIDSGHIPFFGIYIASVWKIFGRDLMTSHLAMLPFVLGIIFQMKKVIARFFEKQHSNLILFLVLIDATLLAQITLVSPDILLVFFFLLSLNSVIINRRILLMIGIFFLFLVSMRGVMVAFIILILDFYYNINLKTSFKEIFRTLIRKSIPYLPAFFLLIAFMIYHYKVKGWIAYHEDSPWATCFEPVDFKGFVFNFGVLAWRILDFGRIGIWIVFVTLFVKYREYIFKDRQTKALFFIFICFITILPLNMLWAKNLLGHRYLLTIYLTFSILSAKVLFAPYVNKTLRLVLIGLWLVSIATGNLWIYPDKVSQGWDSTLAHLPYYKLRKQAIEYIDHQNIDINDVSSFFPNTSSIDEIELNGDKRSFKNYEKDSKYVLYSNIFNVSDQIYDKFKREYILLEEFKSNGIFIKIYSKK